MASRTLSRRFHRLRDRLSTPWVRAILYVMLIPLFPEYLAPVLAILSFVAAAREAHKTHRPIVIGAVGKVLLCFITYFALTTPFAELPGASLSSLALWMLMFLSYLSLTTVITDRGRLEDTLYMVSLVAGLVGLIGCVQYFLRFVGYPVNLQFWEPVDRFVYSFFPFNINLDVTGTRVSSTFSNPNILGQYLVMITPFVAHYAFHGQVTHRRTLCRFCLLACIGCAAFTLSRGTYLALFMIALVLIIANIRNIVTISLSLLSALLLVPETVWTRLSSIGRLDASTLERLNVWQLCIGLFTKEPLFGYGCGVQYTWSVMLANRIPAPHAHNVVLQLLVEGGIVGLCLMLFLGFRVVQSGFALTSRKENRHLGAAILAFAVGFCTNGMVEYGFTFPKVIGAFALVLAITDTACCFQLNRKLSPLAETVTFARWRQGATVKK
ncbi:MAG: O-antigen ligase family protein [Clostridia bacterium]|nr:O-antigen ligase family protein [Clostridia bacterium]